MSFHFIPFPNRHSESSAYYHGYVLAEMSVHQTRAHFKRTLGAIVDQPEVGRQLTEVRPRPQFYDDDLKLFNHISLRARGCVVLL